MRYCENCFEDENLKGFIEENGIKSNPFNCSHCGNFNSKYMIDEYVLSSWIKSIICKVYSYEDGIAYTISKNYVEGDEEINDYAPFRDLYEVCEDLFDCEADTIIEIINNYSSRYG